MHIWQSCQTIKIIVTIDFLLLCSPVALSDRAALVQFSFNYSDFSLEKRLITTVLLIAYKAFCDLDLIQANSQHSVSYCTVHEIRQPNFLTSCSQLHGGYAISHLPFVISQCVDLNVSVLKNQSLPLYQVKCSNQKRETLIISKFIYL